MTRQQRQTVVDTVMAQYAARDGRDVRISRDGWVTIRVDGTGGQMHHGRDLTAGRILAGHVRDFLDD